MLWYPYRELWWCWTVTYPWGRSEVPHARHVGLISGSSLRSAVSRPMLNLMFGARHPNTIHSTPWSFYSAEITYSRNARLLQCSCLKGANTVYITTMGKVCTGYSIGHSVSFRHSAHEPCKLWDQFLSCLIMSWDYCRKLYLLIHLIIYSLHIIFYI